MRILRLGALALGLWTAWGSAAALESYALYDNFSAATLDPVRWQDAERSRLVAGKTLRLTQRDWGLTASDAGSNWLSFSQAMTRSGPATQIRAQVRPMALDMTACAANANPTRVLARVHGTFFNTGNRIAGSNVGDVYARIYTVRYSNSADAPGVLRVEGQLFMCTVADCHDATQLGATVALGTVNLGTSTLLQIDWDRANRQFLFSRDKAAPTALAYSVDDSAEPGAPFKGVGTQTYVANCASGPRATAYIDAKFDNVEVNASAKP